MNKRSTRTAVFSPLQLRNKIKPNTSKKEQKVKFFQHYTLYCWALLAKNVS